MNSCYRGNVTYTFDNLNCVRLLIQLWINAVYLRTKAKFVIYIDCSGFPFKTFITDEVFSLSAAIIEKCRLLQVGFHCTTKNPFTGLISMY